MFFIGKAIRIADSPEHYARHTWEQNRSMCHIEFSGGCGPLVDFLTVSCLRRQVPKVYCVRETLARSLIQTVSESQ